MRGKTWGPGDPYSGLDDFLDPTGYLKAWCTMANHLMRGHFNPQAYGKLRDLLITVAPLVMTRPRGDCKFKSLQDSDFMFFDQPDSEDE